MNESSANRPEAALSFPRERRLVAVQGVVQGVGFRPFVYRLAVEEHLAGSIGNNTEGVTLEVEGSSAQIERFLHRLRTETPPLARIDAVTVQALAPCGEGHFRILASEVHGSVATGIPADAATCEDCRRELLDPADRRYRYAFLNCTNCGPRFTITRRIPYDRPQTSMAVFPLCAECQREYEDPLNRRFHAQPNACTVCGPHLWLTGADGKTIVSADPVQAVIEALVDGKIAAIKGIGGFHLVVDATNEAAVQRLRARKHRYGKPLAVMVRDLAAARALCVLQEAEEQQLLSPAHPIVLARHRPESSLAASVAPGLPWLGIFLPYAPLQHLLFADSRVADTRIRALVMTSANLSEEPICIDNDEALARLGKIADLFLLHDREILQRCDDSVTAFVDGSMQILRRARGYVPLAVDLPLDAPALLAVGGHLKSVFALAKGRFVYQSQHLGDLENLTGLEFFQESFAHLRRTFEIEPTAVVHDLHPAYLSTEWAQRWAAEQKLPLLAVQHHHAHIAGCMAEHAVTEPVIGLALDGTGYGTDGKIWGGEVLIASLHHFERFAHLNYAPLPGGEKAIREPWRMALGALHAAGVDLTQPEIYTLFGAKPEEVRVLARMMERGVNAPLTSSCGRLFDAAAALILGRRVVDYEAQAAIELEGLCVDEPLVLDTPFQLVWQPGNWEQHLPGLLSPTIMLREMLEALAAGHSKPQMAAQFHAAVAAGFVQAAVEARAATGIETVALSGGCMANRRLAALLRMALERQGFRVLRHQRISPGDGGISYGQAAVAAASIGKKL